MARESVVPAQIVREDIRAIEEYPGQFIRVTVGQVEDRPNLFGDLQTAFIVPQQFSTYNVKDDDYTELMSASPAWAPNKPAGTYRNDDLWIFIDRIRSKQ